MPSIQGLATVVGFERLRGAHSWRRGSRYDVTALCCCIAAVFACGGDVDDTDDSISLDSASEADFYGIWEGAVDDDDAISTASRVVWQLEPPAPDAELGVYAIYHEPRINARASLELRQLGEWWYEDDHIVTREQFFSDFFANEVFAVSGNTMTMESAQTSAGQLEYTRAEGCPDTVEREGWYTTSRSLMSLEIQNENTGYTDVAVDSTGRVHVISGGSACDSLTGCGVTAFPTTYYTRTAGCTWRAYTISADSAQPSIRIDADDNIHVFARSFAANGRPWHMTARADETFQGQAAWTASPAGDLTTAVAQSSSAPIQAELDGDGVLWAVEGVPNSESQPNPTVFSWDGSEWRARGADLVESSAAGVDGQVILSADDTGVMRVIAREDGPASGQWQLRVYRADALQDDPLVILGPDPAVADNSAELVDVIVESDGTAHAACRYVLLRPDGNHLFQACYGDYDGEAWTFVPLGLDDLRSIRRRGDGYMLIGESVWWEDSDGVWRAPGPPFATRRTGGGVSVEPGLAMPTDGRAVWDPQNEVMHFADVKWYARYEGSLGAQTDVAVRFEGDGGGVIELVGRDGECASDVECAFSVDAGTVVEMSVVPDETSNFRGFALEVGAEGEAPFATPSGATALLATGERRELVASFDEGRFQGSRSFPRATGESRRRDRRRGSDRVRAVSSRVRVRHAAGAGESAVDVFVRDATGRSAGVSVVP